jgi:hypothetical protein
MIVERFAGESCDPPFPVYHALVPALLAAHRSEGGERDATVAHVLGTAAAYAYADAATVSMMLGRLGFATGGGVRVAQTVDAMYVFSTAYLVQSQCGRVVILAYRGTEPANIGNWVADADVGPDRFALGGEMLAVHAGFRRNVRATQWTVRQELQRALDGRSLADPGRAVDHPMEALYVAGHSLGGAMAVLSALTIVGDAEQHAVAGTLRAVYTFGQPLSVAQPLPRVARALAGRVFRHINAGDIVPTLPPSAWGRFAHFGNEYRYADGEWRRSDVPTAQLEKVRELPRSLLATFAAGNARARARYSMAAHPPYAYLAALRPKDRLTEFGDED